MLSLRKSVVRHEAIGKSSSSSHLLRHTTASTKITTKASKCSMCGSEVESGCDGEGRMIGGLGAVPGFGWWPIKAYRPCPKLDEAGIEYQRKGQILNDVMFGGGSLDKQANATLEEMNKVARKGIKVEPRE